MSAQALRLRSSVRYIVMGLLLLVLLLATIAIIMRLTGRDRMDIQGIWHYYDGICSHFDSVRYEFVDENRFIYSYCGAPGCSTESNPPFRYLSGTYEREGQQVILGVVRGGFPGEVLTITEKALIPVNAGDPRGPAVPAIYVRDKPPECSEDD